MDQRLLEPLEGLISRLIEFGRIDQVAELQAKQLAVMRAIWDLRALICCQSCEE